MRGHFLCLQRPTSGSPLIPSIHSFSSLLHFPYLFLQVLPEEWKGSAINSLWCCGFSLKPCFKESLWRRLGGNGLALNCSVLGLPFTCKNSVVKWEEPRLERESQKPGFKSQLWYKHFTSMVLSVLMCMMRITRTPFRVKYEIMNASNDPSGLASTWLRGKQSERLIPKEPQTSQR